MLIDDRMQDLGRLLDVASLRARVHAGNIANQNTPGYRARAVAFDEAFRETFASRGAAAARQVEAEVFQPRDTGLDNDGNDVNVDREVNILAQNAMLYNAYVTMLRGKYTLLETAVRGPGG